MILRLNLGLANFNVGIKKHNKICSAKNNFPKVTIFANTQEEHEAETLGDAEEANV